MSFNSRYVRIAGLSIGALLIVGAVNSIKGEAQSGISKDDLLQLAEARIKMVSGETEEEVTHQSLDSSIVAFNGKLDKAHELAVADLEAMVCARAGQYLSSAAEASARGMDEGAWLREQLRLENTRVKEALTAHSTLSGSAHHVQQTLEPFLNRAAITKAITNIQQGEVKTCRVSPYDSAIAIDDAIFQGEAIRQNQKIWAQEEVAANE